MTVFEDQKLFWSIVWWS